MIRPRVLLLASISICANGLNAQTGSNAQEFNFQVSSSQPWVDTSLNLQSGDKLEISASSTPSSSSGVPACDPKGITGGSGQGKLALNSAPPGALLARLHAEGGAPQMVGAGAQILIDEPSHLFLGINGASAVTCQGALAVKVTKISAGSSSGIFSKLKAETQSLTSNTGNPDSQSAEPAASSGGGGSQQTREEQLKSQLSSAAQIFMSGQFGAGKSESTAGTSGAVSGGSSSADAATAASPVKVTDAPLDSDLRKSLDSLPRRVNDQFQNLGDMVNFVIVGPQKNVQAAFEAATWRIADTSNEKAVLNAVMETYESKDYLTMPMSTLYLFGRKQDFGYEMAEPIAMVASRHHFRIWKAAFTWKGQEVWVGAGTHDIGFAKDKRNGDVTHKIDPAVDGERDNIASSLQKANKTKTISYYLPPNPIQEAKNATGDGYHSDGRLVVIFLQ